MCRYFWNRRGDPHQTPLNALFFFVFKLRHDEGVKERSFYLCKIQSFYYKKYVQCREIKKIYRFFTKPTEKFRVDLPKCHSMGLATLTLPTYHLRPVS
jgi:hypothetical protein